MKYIKISLVALMLFAFTNVSQAKRDHRILKGFGYGVPVRLQLTPWIIGVGWNFIEDNGKWGNIFTSWNTPYFPSALRVEKYIDKGWSGVFEFNYNQYKPSKQVNSEAPGTHGNYTFMAFDLNAKYDFTELYDVNTEWFGLSEKMFDFYAAAGFGYTSRTAPRVKSCATFNIGFGMNAVFYKGWGMNIQAMSKFGLTGPLFVTPTNYLQYSIGAIYKFKYRPKLGKRGGGRKRYFIARKL